MRLEQGIPAYAFDGGNERRSIGLAGNPNFKLRMVAIVFIVPAADDLYLVAANQPRQFIPRRLCEIKEGMIGQTQRP